MICCNAEVFAAAVAPSRFGREDGRYIAFAGRSGRLPMYLLTLPNLLSRAIARSYVPLGGT